MSKSRLSRRAILRGTAGAALLPVLEACDRFAPPRQGPSVRQRSGTSKTAGRFLAFAFWNGTIPDEFFPDDEGDAFTLKRVLEPLAAHQADMLITSNVDNTACLDTVTNGHIGGVKSMLSGVVPYEDPAGSNKWHPGGRSIDQMIAEHLEQSGVLTRFASLQLGVRTAGSTYGTWAAAGTGQGFGAITDPASAFSLLFDDGASGEELARIRARKLSILDGALADYAGVRDVVSAADRSRIEAHLESLRSVEQRLGAVVDCDPTGHEVPPIANEGEAWQAILDVTALAMSCDVSRVFTLGFDRAGGNALPFTWIGMDKDTHVLSHEVVGASPGSESYEDFMAIQQWYRSTLAAFIDRLKQTNTVEGTLFDDTVIFQGTELSIDHRYDHMPYLLLAGPNTPLVRGRHVRYDSPQAHNRVLTSLCHAFGLRDVEGVGDPKYAGDLDDTLLA